MTNPLVRLTSFPILSNRAFVKDPFFEAFDQMFDQIFSNKGLQQIKDLTRSKAEYPKTDIIEKDNELVFKMAVPGLNAEDIYIEIENNILSVSFNKKEEIEEKIEGNILHKELKQSSFLRSWSLGERIGITEETPVTTYLKNGILEVSIPLIVEKKEEPKKIKIEVKE
mgnify:CR=1 FL=1